MLAVPDRPGSRVFAVLGPTNTGKTHLAIERMLGHETGMIGFPLRLLARENYDRVVRLKGRSRVALITGEEKILPPRAAYFVCTVESMPLDRQVAFLAVDEIQLCADRERGHVFTNRLLASRGTQETMFLGAETMRGLIKRLVPSAEFVGRPRFSELRHVGERKLTRLPRRSAVVAFSATDVYHTAELLRRQRGGTAVVLGALSPRTRNAQVEMYQAGEVDYLVATDAIGMGLNMDIDHVAFARLAKFDGQMPRRLRATEIAQIAGRAGRHMSDGTFGTTDGAGPIDEEIVEAVETHVFDPVRAVQWRNADLDFRGPRALIASLEARPPVAELKRTPNADDHLALVSLARDEGIAGRVGTSREATRLLWDVCQIPDFRKMLTDAHTRLLARVFDQLCGPTGRLDPDWAARQIDGLDRADGDIDTLVQRIAHIRTWTYIAHRPDWLPDPADWQGRARAIEDRLSDALHDRLTQRFVDRRSAVLSRTLEGGAELMAAVNRRGEVLVEGEYVGELSGFRFEPDPAAAGEEAKSLLAVARRALRTEIAARVRRLEAAPDAAFALGGDGRITWEGEPVARLAAGRDALRPKVEPIAGGLLEPAERDRVVRRLDAWVTGHVAEILAPLVRLRDAGLTGPGRGIAFQLVEALGAVPRGSVAELAGALDREGRRDLAACGVRLGSRWIYLAQLCKPRAVALRGLLWSLAVGAALPAPLPAPGAPSMPVAQEAPAGFHEAIGYPPAGGRAVRVDRLEALARRVEVLDKQGPFAADPALAQAVGAPKAALPEILAALGFRAETGEDGRELWRKTGKAKASAKAGAKATGKAKARRDRRRREPAADSPFAKLAALGGTR
ncbi:MAG: helicase-related protein [Azospirillaceae bacterium]